MAIGDVFPPEGKTSADRETGVMVRQLTDQLTHSHHLYFTNSGWWDDGRRLLIGSGRGGAKNLYSVDVGGEGAITQLTDLRPSSANRSQSFLRTAVNPQRDEAYAFIGRELVAIDLRTGERQTLASLPDGFRASMLNVTADGRYVCAGVYEDLSDKFKIDLQHGYVGFPEYHEAKPLSRILRVPTAGGGPAEVIHEEKYWIGHVNTSPTLPNILSFCHEGPWQRVDNRIWCLDHESDKVWPVRQRTEEDERVGHEYWLADGEHLGYHGSRQGKPFFGSVKYDDSEFTEAAFTADSQHFHSNSLDLIVGDGTRSCPRLLLWTYADGQFSAARTLAFHRGSWHTQELHVHPRLTPDSRRVVYSADANGYGNVFIAEIPEDITSLPLTADARK